MVYWRESPLLISTFNLEGDITFDEYYWISSIITPSSYETVERLLLAAGCLVDALGYTIFSSSPCIISMNSNLFKVSPILSESLLYDLCFSSFEHGLFWSSFILVPDFDLFLFVGLLLLNSWTCIFFKSLTCLSKVWRQPFLRLLSSFMVREVVFLEIFFFELEYCFWMSLFLVSLRSIHGSVLILISSVFLKVLSWCFLGLLICAWVFYLWGRDFFFLNIVEETLLLFYMVWNARYSQI